MDMCPASPRALALTAPPKGRRGSSPPRAALQSACFLAKTRKAALHRWSAKQNTVLGDAVTGANRSPSSDRSRMTSVDTNQPQQQTKPTQTKPTVPAQVEGQRCKIHVTINTHLLGRCIFNLFSKLLKVQNSKGCEEDIKQNIYLLFLVDNPLLLVHANTSQKVKRGRACKKEKYILKVFSYFGTAIKRVVQSTTARNVSLSPHLHLCPSDVSLAFHEIKNTHKQF